MASDVIAPEAFNERFTLWANADGAPVQRTLSEMTAHEVIVAVRWHIAEEKRLSAEAEPWQPREDEDDADWVARIGIKSASEAKRVAGLIERAGRAQTKVGRLLIGVKRLMPQWDRHPDTPLTSALRRWWPGGAA